MLRRGGGEVARGELTELYPLPLALLELFLLLRPGFCSLDLLMVFIKLVCAGEKWLPVPQVVLPPGVIGGAWKGVGMLGLWSF